MFLRFLWVFAQLCERSFGGIAASKAASEILHFLGQKNEIKYNFTTFWQDLQRYNERISGKRGTGSQNAEDGF